MPLDVDREAVRDRIRAARPELASLLGPDRPPHTLGELAAATPMSSYRDRDLSSMATASPFAGVGQAPIEPADVPSEDRFVSGPVFLDLDDRPLPSASTGEAAPGAVHAPPSPTAPANAAPPSSVPDDRPDALQLDPPLMRRIIFLATARPGDAPPFSRAQANLDGEGLRYGLGRFSQKSGALGALLAMMHREEPERFAEIFGDRSDPELGEPDIAELLAVTQAPVPEGDTDRSARLIEVSGRPLWHPAWVRRFKAAAGVEHFQAIQYRLAAERALLPMLAFARDFGLASERGLTMLTERSILLGIEAAQEFAIAAAGPINTDALRSAALLHTADDPRRATLTAFQEARGIPERLGHFGPLSHAALVAAIRMSDSPPIQLPSADLMLDQIVAEAVRNGLPGLLPDIRSNPSLSDAELAPVDPVME